MKALKKEEKLLMLLLEDLIREEKRGSVFFKEAARVSTDSDVRKVFEWLSLEEQNHLDVLTKLKAELDMELSSGAKKSTVQRNGRKVDVIDLSDMMMEDIDLPYLELFKNEDFVELFKNISVLSVIQYAMKVEYDNVHYIKEFLSFIKSKSMADILIRLINDEKQHFLVLEKQLTKIS
jgi:rubrerythrin